MRSQPGQLLPAVAADRHPSGVQIRVRARSGFPRTGHHSRLPRRHQRKTQSARGARASHTGRLTGWKGATAPSDVLRHVPVRTAATATPHAVVSGSGPSQRGIAGRLQLIVSAPSAALSHTPLSVNPASPQPPIPLRTPPSGPSPTCCASPSDALRSADHPPRIRAPREEPAAYPCPPSPSWTCPPDRQRNSLI